MKAVFWGGDRSRAVSRRRDALNGAGPNGRREGSPLPRCHRLLQGGGNGDPQSFEQRALKCSRFYAVASAVRPAFGCSAVIRTDERKKNRTRSVIANDIAAELIQNACQFLVTVPFGFVMEK